MVPGEGPPPSCCRPPRNRGSGRTGSLIHSPVLHYPERTSIGKRKGEEKGKEGKEGEGKGKGNGGVIVTKCAVSSLLNKSPSQPSGETGALPRLLFSFENNLREKQ